MSQDKVAGYIGSNFTFPRAKTKWQANGFKLHLPMSQDKVAGQWIQTSWQANEFKPSSYEPRQSGGCLSSNHLSMNRDKMAGYMGSNFIFSGAKTKWQSCMGPRFSITDSEENILPHSPPTATNRKTKGNLDFLLPVRGLIFCEYDGSITSGILGRV